MLREKGSKTKKRMKKEEIEKGDCGLPTRKVFFFVEILLDLSLAVPNHHADESQMLKPDIPTDHSLRRMARCSRLTRLTFVILFLSPNNLHSISRFPVLALA